jgi:hypothetical protein
MMKRLTDIFRTPAPDWAMIIEPRCNVLPDGSIKFSMTTRVEGKVDL